MATGPKGASRRRLWRIALVVLVVIPLLPEIVVLSVSAIANLNGCRVDDEPPTVNNWRQRTSTPAAPPPGATTDDAAGRPSVYTGVPPDPWMVADLPATGSASGAPAKVCSIGPFPPVSAIIRPALNAAFLVGDAFSSGAVIIWLALCYVVITRGWTGFLARLTLALLVCLIFAFIPYFGIPETQNCQLNDDGAGSCIMYGGDVRSIVHQNVILGLRVVVGAPLAFGTFLLYLLFLLIAALVSRKAAGRSA